MEIPISGDIRKIQSKDIGNFSFKQAAFIAAACASAFVLFKFTGQLEISFVPAAIILVFGFFKPYGMTFFTFLRTFAYERIFSPQEYVYENDFEVDNETIELYAKDGVDVSDAIYVIQTEEPQNSHIKWTKEDKQRIAL
ncbi:MAG: PrgI family protein [Clostridia bacterium]|nr:PrgI family protein [Clostridia bacterium]